MKLDIKETETLPEGVTATYQDKIMTIKGPKGEVARLLRDPMVKIESKDNTITISCKKATKREKRVINTFMAHVNNIIKGVQEPYQYKLKICSGHFPMNVSTTADQLIVKNFLGEKSPRAIKLKKGVTVKIEGDNITVESSDKERAGNMASDIELLTTKRNRDLRIFQDGIYLIEKAGSDI